MHGGETDRAARESITGKGCTVWMTGLSASGKSSLAFRCEALLVASGRAAYCLDGDNLRHGLNADLGFTPEDRAENVRRVGETARLMADAGLTVFVPVISPYSADRAAVRSAHDAAGIPFFEVYLATPLPVCEARDPKGLYAKARSGEVPDFTGISAPYEAPEHPDLTVDTSVMTLDEGAAAVLSLIG